MVQISCGCHRRSSGEGPCSRRRKGGLAPVPRFNSQSDVAVHCWSPSRTTGSSVTTARVHVASPLVSFCRESGGAVTIPSSYSVSRQPFMNEGQCPCGSLRRPAIEFVHATGRACGPEWTTKFCCWLRATQLMFRAHRNSLHNELVSR